MVSDRNFLDGEVLCPGLHDHLAGELHAGGGTVEGLPRLLTEYSEATMGVQDARTVERVQELGQEGVANVLVEFGHGAGLDLTVEPTSHDHVCAAINHGPEQSGEALEVIRRVSVANRDVVAAGVFEHILTRVAVSLAIGVVDDGTHFTGDLGRAVGGVVADDDFGGDTEFLDARLDALDTFDDTCFLIECRHHNAQCRRDVALTNRILRFKHPASHFDKSSWKECNHVLSAPIINRN